MGLSERVDREKNFDSDESSAKRYDTDKLICRKNFASALIFVNSEIV